MNARDKILNNIRRWKPEFAVRDAGYPVGDQHVSIDNFKNAIQANGGDVFEAHDLSAIESFIASQYAPGTKVVSNIVGATMSIHAGRSSSEMNTVDVCVLKAELGVAENGALWLPEKNMIDRCLPFITQHLIVLINKEDIVSDMHEAYRKITLGGYGVFIAGPSKTADIEQSLVIGAHGARSHTVFLLP
jgi:L-lactate dehydrogenase complex protein LldG